MLSHIGTDVLDECVSSCQGALREYPLTPYRNFCFLRRIGTTHELGGYDTVRQEPSTEKSEWQKDGDSEDSQKSAHSSAPV